MGAENEGCTDIQDGECLQEAFFVGRRLGIEPQSFTKVQHLSFEYFTSRGVTLAGAKAANRV